MYKVSKQFKFYAPDGDQGGGSGDDAGNKNNDRLEYLEKELKTVIGDRDTLKTKLKDFEESKRKAEEDKLLEDGKLKEALTLKEKELNELNTKYADVEKKAKQYDEFVESEYKKEEELFGKLWKPSYRNLSIQDLRELRESLTLPDKGLDTSNPGRNKKDNETITLTENEKKQAAQMGLSEEGFIAYKKRTEELEAKKKKN